MDELEVQKRFDAGGWKTIQSNRKLAACRQIEAALYHLHLGGYECAATLALAAEGQLPDTDATTLWNALKRHRSDKEYLSLINELRDWLKHRKEPDQRDISEFEAVIALVRATTKYYAAFNEETVDMQTFIRWCVSKKVFWSAEPSVS
jgi:hypothetical protein